MIRWVFLFLGSLPLFGQSFVFVHVGPNIPAYLPYAIRQVRLFNKEWPIYVIASADELKKLPSGLSHTPIPLEDIPRSEAHEKFHAEGIQSGFWRYTSERFFYLDSFIKKYNLKDVFHLENDVMLYCDLSKLLPIFQSYYRGMIGATFENERKCIPGFVYISESAPLEKLARYMAEMAKFGAIDMIVLGNFRNSHHRIYIDYLPVVLPNYDFPFQNALGVTAQSPALYYTHFEEFDSLFDAAAFGMYIGGNDPIHPKARPGFISESSFFNPSLFDFEWIKDEEGRQVPYVSYKGMRCRLNNLHVHCKNLGAFFSLNQQMPSLGLHR
jgi:hypothetical protein